MARSWPSHSPARLRPRAENTPSFRQVDQQPIKQTGYGGNLSVGRKGNERITMIDKNFAEHFARDWIDSWNSHELDRILSHYSDQFEMSSPVIIQVVGEPSGTLKGKDAVGAYWAKALSLISDLRF
jgi:hypothetical protein